MTRRQLLASLACSQVKRNPSTHPVAGDRFICDQGSGVITDADEVRVCWTTRRHGSDKEWDGWNYLLGWPDMLTQCTNLRWL